MKVIKKSWPLNKSSAILLAILISGCNSGHESSGGDNGTPDPTPDPTPSPDVVTISIPSTVTFTEPTSGSGTESIIVSLSEALEQDLTLTLSTSDVTTRSSGTFKNYDAIPSQDIQIAAGVTSADLPLNLMHNNLYEGSKILHYSISAVNDTNYTLSNERTVVTINDSDTQPTVSFSNDLSTVVEGDSIIQQAVLSHYTSKDVTLTLTQTGIAAPEDFIVDISELTLKLPAETLSTDITFSASDDSFDEGGESVIYTIASVGNATIDSSKKTLAFYIPGQKSFNDTGYVTYFDGTDYDSVTPPASYPNQDADFGLDVTNGNEHSDGEYGFRYTKLDAHGNPLLPSATNWRCVKDEHSGLYIEAKQAPIALPSQSDVDTWVKNHKNDPDANPYLWESQSQSWRSASYTYTWHDSDSTTNGGYAGAVNDLLYSAGPISSQCAYTNDSSGSNHCNTSSYIDSLNSRSICGITDWRLPSPVEARSFINFNVGTAPTGGIDFFPNLGDRLFTHSSSVKQDGSARCIDSQNGELELCNKNITHSTGIVAVSGGIE